MYNLKCFPLHPHHALCAQFFEGKGYSESFVRHMAETLAALNRGADVTLVDGCDAICAGCPHKRDGVCETDAKVTAIDRRVLAAMGLQFGKTLPWRELSALAKDRIVAPGRLKEICRDCEWIGICGDSNGIGKENSMEEFRTMRRFKQALTEADCAALLRTEKRGTLALIGDGGYPYAVPINFYYDEAARKIYFHTAKSGHKIDAMQTCDKVCFTVHDAGEQRGDWSYYVKSVIVFGHVQPVTDPAVKYEKAKAFGMKYYPSEEALDRELERDFDRMQIMEITVAHMTGKLVHEQ